MNGLYTCSCFPSEGFIERKQDFRTCRAIETSCILQLEKHSDALCLWALCRHHHSLCEHFRADSESEDILSSKNSQKSVIILHFTPTRLQLYCRLDRTLQLDSVFKGRKQSGESDGSICRTINISIIVFIVLPPTLYASTTTFMQKHVVASLRMGQWFTVWDNCLVLKWV